MIDHYHAVIMAGGGGTRLWPLSRQARPKQMLKLGSDQTLFEQAVNRLWGVFPSERIWVVTVAEQASQLQQQAPQIPASNYLLEPQPRGTASVVAWAAAELQRRDPRAVMAVLTADHIIQNVDEFSRLLGSAEKLARQGFLVTLGIEPSYAATGYGYIQRGDRLEFDGERPAYEVLRFKEKPDQQTARQLLAGGDHYWNSGMFVWQVDRILAEFERQMPELAAQIETIMSAWGSQEREAALQSVWTDIIPQTIDYGIMERASRVAVLPAGSLGWNDVGSWESLFDVLDADTAGNVVLQARHLGLDTNNSLVLSDNDRRLIVTIGIDDLVIIDTADALLVARRDQSQRVREIVQRLKKDQPGSFL